MRPGPRSWPCLQPTADTLTSLSTMKPTHRQVGLVPLLELLLQNGARAGWADAAGRQPLHYAVLAGRTEAAKLLVKPPFVHAWPSRTLTCALAARLQCLYRHVDIYLACAR